jgi:N6-adenosine-specific RNA methylase IME4
VRRFRALLADPPWTFATYSAKGRGRSAENHYKTMSLDDIFDFKLPPMADDSVLFLWTTDPLLTTALQVMKEWGFRYQTVGFVWAKTNKNGDGFPMGLGFWARSNPEICLMGTRGKPHRIGKDVPKLVVAPRGKHSAKPDEVNHRIRRLVQGPYVEIFARRKIEGWTCLGDEL